MVRWFCKLPTDNFDHQMVVFGPVGMRPEEIYSIATADERVRRSMRFARGTSLNTKPHFTQGMKINNAWRRCKSRHIDKGVRVFMAKRDWL